MTAMLWRDNRVVTLLSTNSQPQNQSTVQRQQHDGTRSSIPYIFWCLFEVCLANSYILHKHFSGGAKLTLKEFRLEVVRGLIGNYNSRKWAGRSSQMPTVLPIRHFPVKHLQGERAIRVQCGKQSQWWCQDCKMHLCHTGIPATDYFMKQHS